MLLEVCFNHCPSVVRVYHLIIKGDLWDLLLLFLLSWGLWLLATIVQEILLAVVHLCEFSF